MANPTMYFFMFIAGAFARCATVHQSAGVCRPLGIHCFSMIPISILIIEKAVSAHREEKGMPDNHYEAINFVGLSLQERPRQHLQDHPRTSLPWLLRQINWNGFKARTASISNPNFFGISRAVLSVS